MAEKTTKQQRFIDCYGGDIKEAAEKAGLSYDYARRLVTKSHIIEAIRNREQTESRPKDIADRQERQAFWTEIERDKSQSTGDRLRASELLGKSEIDFVEKRIDDSRLNLADIAARMGIKHVESKVIEGKAGNDPVQAVPE